MGWGGGNRREFTWQGRGKRKRKRRWQKRRGEKSDGWEEIKTTGLVQRQSKYNIGKLTN